MDPLLILLTVAALLVAGRVVVELWRGLVSTAPNLPDMESLPPDAGLWRGSPGASGPQSGRF